MVFVIFLLACFVALLAQCGGRVEVARPAPPWILQLDTDPEIDKGIVGVSDGFTITSPTTVLRQRTGNFETDGAKWGAALDKGKHVFEINWPKDTRGLFATVGVGSSSADTFVKPRDSLVGKDRFSWGLDIARRKLVHRGQPTGNMPRGMVPDKFYMYVDCDSGTLGYGSDIEYWGAPHNIPREHFPVYPMLGCCCHNASITMIYRGSENKDKPHMALNQVTVAAPDGSQQPSAPKYQPPPGAGYGPSVKADEKGDKPKDELDMAVDMAKKGYKVFDKFMFN